MTAPTAPSLATLSAEALKKAGYTSTGSSQYTTLLNRAQTEWMEEVKNDLYMMEKQLVSLQTTYVHVTAEGLSKYSLPTDYGINMSMSLLSGEDTGTFQAGSTNTSWILDAAEDATESDLLGKEILVYSGTGINQLGQVTNYEATTQTATVTITSGSITTSPAAGDGYVIIDNYYELTPMQAWEYEAVSNQKEPGVPNRFSITGDADDGEFYLYPAPYRTSGVPWGIKQRYYADLQRVDLASTTMTTLYRRWRNLWVQGVKAKCWESQDDNRAGAALQLYGQLLNMVVNSEKYGVDAPADMEFAPQFRR